MLPMVSFFFFFFFFLVARLYLSRLHDIRGKIMLSIFFLHPPSYIKISILLCLLISESLIQSFSRSTKRVVKKTLFKVLSIRLTSKIKYKQTTSARQFLTTGIVVRPSFIIYYSKNNRHP